MGEDGFWNTVSIEELEEGDHIYCYRFLFTYAHHGIYMGDGRVIHFGPEHDSNRRFCADCQNDLGKGGVTLICLPCFLNGSSLRRYKYGVSGSHYRLSRGGSCCFDPRDKSRKAILARARSALGQGFSTYSLLLNNCETFSKYCATGSPHYYPHQSNTTSTITTSSNTTTTTTNNNNNDDDDDDNDDIKKINKNNNNNGSVGSSILPAPTPPAPCKSEQVRSVIASVGNLGKGVTAIGAGILIARYLLKDEEDETEAEERENSHRHNGENTTSVDTIGKILVGLGSGMQVSSLIGASLAAPSPSQLPTFLW